MGNPEKPKKKEKGGELKLVGISYRLESEAIELNNKFGMMKSKAYKYNNGDHKLLSTHVPFTFLSLCCLFVLFSGQQIKEK